MGHESEFSLLGITLNIDLGAIKYFRYFLLYYYYFYELMGGKIHA